MLHLFFQGLGSLPAPMDADWFPISSVLHTKNPIHVLNYLSMIICRVELKEYKNIDMEWLFYMSEISKIANRVYLHHFRSSLEIETMSLEWRSRILFL